MYNFNESRRAGFHADIYADQYKEMDEFYSKYPVDIRNVVQQMNLKLRQCKSQFSYEKKAITYETSADMCDVHLFRHSPFYYEFMNGRGRYSWGFGGTGGWFSDLPEWKEQFSNWEAALKDFGEQGLASTSFSYDYDHHTLGYDLVLQDGLKGIRRKAEVRLTTTSDEKEVSFLNSVIIAIDSLKKIADKFSIKAVAMLEYEENPDVRKNLERIRDTACRVPWNAPQTFYEALNTILFMREVCTSLDGIGISILGHIDRMLFPFYKNDLEKGILTQQEACDLLASFLTWVDIKFNTKIAYNEASVTIVIGGCDRYGNIVFNEITKMILGIYEDFRLVNPKLNIRISKSHTREFFQMIARLLLQGSNVIALFNDDVLIPANAAYGKKIEDAREYVGGGCQENILQNCEINSRCSIYLNLLNVLSLSYSPDKGSLVSAEEKYLHDIPGFINKDIYEHTTFEEFYSHYIYLLKTIASYLIHRRKISESQGYIYNPCPMLSAFIGDCIEKKKDITEGGARYSSGCINFIGIGTLIDSLYSIKHLVFDRKTIAFNELIKACSSNFEGYEALHQYIIDKIPKYGQNHTELKPFISQVFDDIAHITDDECNSRDGGRYEPSVMSFLLNIYQGEKTQATPDGRRKGEKLSVGMSPSDLASRKDGSITDIMNELQSIDLLKYPQVAVLDIKLPFGGTSELMANAVSDLFRVFLAYNGSVLQPNYLDQNTLLDAKQNPEKHEDLIVRVTGFSAYFTTLDKTMQDAVISRTSYR